MKPYYVYMVECTDSSLYTGITTDLRRRIDQHNGLIPGGARYTKLKRPVFLAYFEKTANRSEATRREHQLKSLSHTEKMSMVNQTTKEQLLASI